MEVQSESEGARSTPISEEPETRSPRGASKEIVNEGKNSDVR